MIAYAREHPLLGHPWTDPFAPSDFLNPRPDWAFQTAGAFAPRAEDFPFTDTGKREYYAAVERAAHQQMAMQQQVMMQRETARQHEAAERVMRERRDHLLLLRR